MEPEAAGPPPPVPPVPPPAAPAAVRGARGLFAAAWLAFAVPALVLGAALPAGVLRDADLPLWAGLALAGTELALAALPAALAAGLWALLGRGIRRAAVPWRRRLVRALRALLVGVLLFAVAGSWAQFALTGQFLDRIGAIFVTANLGALWHFAAVMYPLLLAGIPLVVLAFAVLFSEVLPRRLARRPSALRVLRRVAIAGILLAASFAAGEVARRSAGAAVYDTATGIDRPFAAYYALRRNFHAGPVTHLLASLVGGAGAPGDRGAPRPPVREVRRPLCGMEDYLAGADPARERRLNVVLLCADSLRADLLRAYGAPAEVMPVVEAIAREGRVFSDCLSPASHTDYATPSLLSSQSPLRAPDYHKYPTHPSYPRVLLHDILRARGYRVAVFSSQGESWCGMIRYLRPDTLDRFFDASTFAATPPRDPEAEAVARESRKNPDPHIDDRFTVGEALAWAETVKDGPFFLYVNLQGIHSPYLTPPGFAPRFATAPRDFAIGYGNWPRERAGAVRGFYTDCAAYVDTQVARVVGFLRERGLWDQTVVVVTGDHGEGFYEHGFAAHGAALYDEALRVPLVVRVPGLPPAIDPRPAQILDVPPTVCHALGLPPHPAFQGADLFDPATAGERSRYLVVQTPVARQVAIVRGGRKLIRDLQERRSILYDLANDPGERRDVSAERPAVRADLEARLGAWFEAQVGYYRDTARQAREYPPVLVEE